MFIDARKMGTMIDRRHRILTEEDIKKISSVYHAWRGEGSEYNDIPGFCKSSDIEEIRKNNYVITPGRYVGAEVEEEDVEEFEEKMQKLISKLKLQMEEGARLDGEIKKNLERIGWLI